MIKAIIFDLDGTLLDTSRDIRKVLNESLERFGLPAVSMENALKYLGNGARKLVARAVGGDDLTLIEEVYGDYFKRFAECDNKLTTLYDGEREVLERFLNSGIRLAVLTNKPQKAAERVVKQLLGGIGFEYIYGDSPEHPLKPNPATTLEIMAKLGVEKSETLFVGDGDADAKTAANAGIRCVSALWGFRTQSELESAGATEFARNFKELENKVFFA